MKTFIFIALALLSFSSFAQQVLDVNSGLIDLGDVRETNYGGTKKVVLRLSANTPDKFKVKFVYQYHFTSKEIDSILITPGGIGDISMRTRSEYFEGKEVVKFDVSESNLKSGEELEVLVEISKPNKNTHGVRVVSKLKADKGNQISGGKSLLGLLGHKFSIKAGCE